VNRILKDPVLQERFEADGFVRLPLLGKEEIAELTQYYMRHTGGDVKNSVYGMWVSLHDRDDIDFKRQTMDEIRRVTLPRLNEFFIDCKPHLGSYLVKVPNPRSFTFPHQDWTFVDNQQMQDLCSLTVWITLKDVTITGGTLGFVKGSPKFFDHVIGSPSPAIKTATQGHEPMLFEYLSYESVRAGDALAFNNRTIHAAMPKHDRGAAHRARHRHDAGAGGSLSLLPQARHQRPSAQAEGRRRVLRPLQQPGAVRSVSAGQDPRLLPGGRRARVPLHAVVARRHERDVRAARLGAQRHGGQPARLGGTRCSFPIRSIRPSSMRPAI
jgi:hypothetical protein